MTAGIVVVGAAAGVLVASGCLEPFLSTATVGGFRRYFVMVQAY